MDYCGYCGTMLDDLGECPVDRSVRDYEAEAKAMHLENDFAGRLGKQVEAIREISHIHSEMDNIADIEIGQLG